MLLIGHAEYSSPARQHGLDVTDDADEGCTSAVNLDRADHTADHTDEGGASICPHMCTRCIIKLGSDVPDVCVLALSFWICMYLERCINRSCRRGMSNVLPR